MDNSTEISSVLSDPPSSLVELVSNTSGAHSQTNSDNSTDLRESQETLNIAIGLDNNPFKLATGYILSTASKRDRTSWVWQHGLDITRKADGERFWRCNIC
jgi:hypothetical protein